jgi:glycosyltransferase involved in cell wall biosynthesis
MEFRPFHLAEEWQKNGHQALIVGADFSHLRAKNPASEGFEIKDNVNYYWIKTPKYKGNGVGRVLNIFAFVGRLFLQNKTILNHIKPDVVVASSTYPFDIFPAWYIAKKTKAKLVFEIHDLWPLSLTELGGMSKYHPFVLAVALAEKFAYRLPDKIISILPKTFAHAKKFGVKSENFSVIPNGIVIKDWDNKEKLPTSHKKEIDKLKEQGKFLVGYAGAHGVANALTYLIDAAKILENKNIHIILVGDGQEKENLVKYAEKQGVTNISFLGRIRKNAIPTILEQMDSLYIGWQKQPIYSFGISANKIFDYMMSAKPIIHSVNAGNDPIYEANCGLSVESEDANLLAEAMLKISQITVQERDKLGLSGKEYVMAKHDYKILAGDFLKGVL